MTDPNQPLVDLIDAATAAMRAVLDGARQLLGDGGTSHIHAVALYATITELFSGCIVLAEEDEATGVPILVRSMYEALVDLDNLLHIDSYVEHIESANLKQMLRLLKSAKTNPLLAGLRLDDTLAFEALLAERIASKRGPLNFHARCKMAGRVEEYESFYALFSLDTHNNSAALADRHIRELPDGTPDISFFGKAEPRMVAMRLNMGLKMLIESTRMIHGAFQTNSKPIVELLAHYDRVFAEARRGS